MATNPEIQSAVQLTGPDQLTLNPAKAVHRPGPHQVLCRVEVVGLCFSDLKLLKQFAGHPRKSEILSGVDLSVLKSVPSYVPGNAPTVPGHETVVQVVEIGPHVTRMNAGDRFLVQADYRWLKTSGSNAAFGYNFEGALQEYVLFDLRTVTAPDGESMLIPARKDLSASAIALAEPWACVEDSYVARERQGLKPEGRLLVWVQAGKDAGPARDFVEAEARHSEVVWCSRSPAPSVAELQSVASLDELRRAAYDDILFVGNDPDALEQAFLLMAPGALINIVLCGKTLGRPVMTPVGRLHYGALRVTGTTGADIRAGYKAIPASGEIRPGERIQVVGAGGPMGTMHVIRDLCQGVPGITVLAGDMSAERLDNMRSFGTELAAKNGVVFEAYNPAMNPVSGPFSYIALMVPSAKLLEIAVQEAGPRGIINIFAGIPANVEHPINLDVYLGNQAYFIGTSGSTLEDMKIVLRKVEARALDTNLSVAAISGLDGAVEGIRAVEKQLIPGKILVYPNCKGLGLTPLNQLGAKLPQVAAALRDGRWTAEAEKALLAAYP